MNLIVLGSITIAGVTIKCWRSYNPHGTQCLRTGLVNSCNPVFISLGQQIGVETFYNYLEKFGLLSKTGIDLPGEASSIFFKEENVGPIELATLSFGQRFEITPIQMITTIATIANDGTYIAPRIVKQIIDSSTNEITEIESETRENVISEQTANDVLGMMENVVLEGTGRGAQVYGYSIGGKTGTSEDGINTNKYIASFVGVSTIENPKLVILVTLYNPTGEGGHQGGGVAAPVASQILGEVLPYMEVEKTEQLEVKNEVLTPNIIGLSINDAKNELLNANLDFNYTLDENMDEDETVVKSQLPMNGIKVYEGTKINIEY